ncbi:DUF6197 family protein [Streptomyces yaizuensis]|uniref:DUF6197 family protein n=1 Tax=Streptomyces yaizuensis TaxID=2989713 RepID=UPI002B21071D|nr:DUF6197 family protein [Streptomyces sp. YSPA8]
MACWPRGAIEIAAGHSLGSTRRTYDWARIHTARDQALCAFAEHLTRHPADACGAAAAKRLAHEVIDRWSAEPDRTAENVAQALRAAADALGPCRP